MLKCIFGIPQGSIFELLVFNAYLCHLFYDIDDVGFANFAATKLHFLAYLFFSVFGQLKGGIDKIFDWFTKNTLKGSADKCQLITSSKASVEIEVSNITVISYEKVKLLETFIDDRLNCIV